MCIRYRGDLIGTGSGLLLCPGGIQRFYGDETNRPMVAGVPNDGNGGAGHSLRSDMNLSLIHIFRLAGTALLLTKSSTSRLQPSFRLKLTDWRATANG